MPKRADKQQTSQAQITATSGRPVKKLIGFKTTYSVPKEISSASKHFVKNCATADIENELEKIWAACREEFNYKRRDKLGPTIEDGHGTLTLPDFRYGIQVSQDEANPEYVVWHQTIDQIKDLSFALSDSFNRVFPKNFDSLEAHFPSPKNIEDLIDRVEDLNSKKISVTYPANCAYCEIFILDLAISILVTPNTFKINLKACPSPKALIQKILEVQHAIKEMSPQDPWLVFF